MVSQPEKGRPKSKRMRTPGSQRRDIDRDSDTSGLFETFSDKTDPAEDSFSLLDDRASDGFVFVRGRERHTGGPRKLRNASLFYHGDVRD